MEIWPNFFIAGAQRTVTPSLYKYLKTAIRMPSGNLSVAIFKTKKF